MALGRAGGRVVPLDGCASFPLNQSQQGLEGLERPSSTGHSGVARAGYLSSTCTVTSRGELTAEQICTSSSHLFFSLRPLHVRLFPLCRLAVCSPLRLIGGWRSRNQTLETKKEWKKREEKKDEAGDTAPSFARACATTQPVSVGKGVESSNRS